jgi:alpha-beta hydrolase superfamily lysophospholipase
MDSLPLSGVKRRRSLVLRLLLYIVIGYSALVVAAYLWQRRMLYFPDCSRPSENDCRAVGLRFWPRSGDGYRGFSGIAPPAGTRGLVTVFHGNAGAAWNRAYYVHALGPLGYRVVVAEYPGYGGRGGQRGERPFVEDAKETVRRAHEAFGGPVFLWGESLGCGVASAVAADPPVPIAGVVMLTPWDSLPDVAQTLYWYFPARWLLRDRYDNVRNMRSYAQPVAVVVAERDEIIPKKRSMRLYDALAGPKQLWVLEGAGHNSWPTGSNEAWWRAVMDFVASQHERKAQ